MTERNNPGTADSGYATQQPPEKTETSALHASNEEQSVIGSILKDEAEHNLALYQQVWERAKAVLKPEHFTTSERQRIFEIMFELKEKHPADRLDCIAINSYDPSISLSALTGLMDYGIVATAEQNIRKTGHAYLSRKFLEETTKVRALAEQGEIGNAINEWRDELDRINELTSAPKNMKGYLPELLDDLIDEGAVIPTFSESFNRFLNGGFRSGRTYTIAAPSGHGKSDFVLQLLDETARNSIKQAGKTNRPETISIYVSMEMGMGEHLIRSFSRIGKIDSRWLDAQVWRYHADKDAFDISDEERQEIMERILSGGDIARAYDQDIGPAMYILHGQPGWTVQTIRAEVTRIRSYHRTRDKLSALPKALVTVDPFNMLSCGDRMVDRDETRSGGILAGQLKQMARDIDVPVIIVADTTKEAARQAEEENAKASQVDPRGSYEITHRTNVQFTFMTGDDLPEKKDAEWVKLAGDMKKKHGNLSPYACLQPTKHREGVKGPVWFIYDKPFHTFIPLNPPERPREL